MSDSADVVVVGGGPAGSMTALFCARHGLRVVLCDRARFPRPKPCGEYLSPGVAAFLAEHGLGGVLAAQGPESTPGMEIVSPSGRRLRIAYDLATSSAYTLRRDVLDFTLLEAAAASGADVRTACRVTDLLRSDRGVTGVAAGGGMIRAPLTVVADGARSGLAGRLGLARKPRWPVRLGLVAHVAGRPALEGGFGQMHVRRDGYCGIVALPGGETNIAAVVPLDAVRRSGLDAATFLRRWLTRSDVISAVLAACEPVRSVRGAAPIGARCRRPWYPGALLVGDAAGFFDPFTGEGVYRALAGAELAASTAAAALGQGGPTAARLAPYGRARTAAFRPKLAVTALVQLFVQSPALLDYALPRLGMRPQPHHTLSLVLGDVLDARHFLTPTMLWSALRP